MSDEHDVMGVYSHNEKYEALAGVRRSRYRHGTYWYVVKLDEQRFEVRPINANHVPTNMSREVSREDFLQYFTPELDYYENNTLPCLETLRKKVHMGRRYFNLGLLDDSEKEFSAAVLMQDDSIPGNIGLSEVYAEQKDFSKLRAVLDKLMGIDAVFKEEQRHQFNEFGINLRKKELYDDAIRFYIKALEVNDEDENLHFNISRAYHGKELFSRCHSHLERALEINPEMREAKCLMKLISTESKTVARLQERAKTRDRMSPNRDEGVSEKAKTVYVIEF